MYVLSGCVPRHAICIWVPALDQKMSENGTFELYISSTKWYFDHLTVSKWLLQKTSVDSTVPPLLTGAWCPAFASWMWITSGATDMLEAAFFAKFVVTVELVVLSTSWLIGFSLMQLKDSWHQCMFARPQWAAVGCMVKLLTMNTPIFGANCLPG